jgi:hypothetical protein
MNLQCCWGVWGIIFRVVRREDFVYNVYITTRVKLVLLGGGGGEGGTALQTFVPITSKNSASVFKLPSALDCCFSELLSPYSFSLDVH